MFYFVSVILFLNFGFSEQAITGPFKTKENCVQYKQSIDALQQNFPYVKVLKSECIFKEEKAA